MGRERVASAGGTALILVMVVVAVVSVATEVAEAGPHLGVVEVVSRDGDGDGDSDSGGEDDDETGGGHAAVDTTGGAGAAGLDWPEGVGELATFVEEERGLQFLRPVAIEFLTPDDYATEVSGGLDEDDDVGDDVADAQFGYLRAFGLMVNDADPVGAGADLTGEATGGMYQLGEDRIVVNGDGPLTTLQRRTLVHELTHAVTDQHLGTLDAFRAVGTAEEAIALQALIEGDAERVSMRWLESLPQDELAAIEDDQAAIDSELAADVVAAPSALVASLVLPYAVGPAFVEAVLADGGPAALDAAYSAPPVTLEQVMDPIAYLEGDEPDHVPAPELPEGASVRGQPWTWGAYGVYTLLASRLSPQQALVAAQGWAGDTVVDWERDGHACAALAVRGETPSDDAELAEAMRAWAEAAPGASGNGPLAGGGWFVTGCAPGAADAVVHPALDTTSFLALRSTLLADAVRFEAFDLDVASAVADCTMAALDYEALVAPGADPQANRRAVIDAWTGCADVAGEFPVES